MAKPLLELLKTRDAWNMLKMLFVTRSTTNDAVTTGNRFVEAAVATSSKNHLQLYIGHSDLVSRQLRSFHISRWGHFINRLWGGE